MPAVDAWDRARVWIDEHPLRGLALIVLIDLALDLASLWTHRAAILPLGETNQYWQIALHVASGRGYVGCFPGYFPFCRPDDPTAIREPGGVLPFAAVAKVTGGSLYAATLVELAIDLAILPGVFLLARRLTGARGALLAALFWAAYLPPITDFVPTVSGDLLAALGVTWGLYFVVRGMDTGRWRDWLVAGAGFGLAALAREAMIVVAPAVAIWLPWRLLAPGRGSGRLPRRELGRVAILALVPAAMLTPWAVWNTAAFGQPVLGSTLTGYNLYRMNYMLPDSTFLPLHFVGDAEARRAVATLWAQQLAPAVRPNEAQTDAVYRRAALGIIAAHPLRYALLSASRFFMLWFDWTVAPAYGARPGYLTGIQQGLLLLSAAIGFARARCRAWPVAACIVAVTLAFMAVAGRQLYVTPVMPSTVVLSAIGCEWLAGRLGVPGGGAAARGEP